MSGDYKIRMEPEAHRSLKALAAEMGLPMGKLVAPLVERARLWLKVEQLVGQDHNWQATGEASALLVEHDRLLGRAQNVLKKYGAA